MYSRHLSHTHTCYHINEEVDHFYKMPATTIDTCNQKWHVVIKRMSVLTSARWWCWLKFCCVHIHQSTCWGCVSEQLKARITGVCSHVTNRIAIECHRAIANVNGIVTQCCKARIKCIMQRCTCVLELIVLGAILAAEKLIGLSHAHKCIQNIYWWFLSTQV